MADQPKCSTRPRAPQQDGPPCRRRAKPLPERDACGAARSGVAYTAPGGHGLNLAQFLVARGARPSGPTGAAARRANALALRRARRSRRAARRTSARARPRARRPRRAADEEPPVVPRGAVRGLVGGPRGGAGQRQAASGGSRLHRRSLGGRRDGRDRRSRRERRAASSRLREMLVPGTPATRPRSAPSRSPPRRARPRTSPGSSTPAARRAGRRA